MSERNQLYTLVKRAKVILWDEIIMAHRHLVEALDRSLKLICGNDLPFGGKVIVFAGDAKQILPITLKYSRGAAVNATLMKTKLYLNKFIKLRTLTKNRRIIDTNATESLKKKTFLQFQEKIGNGTYPTLKHKNPYVSNHLVKLPNQFVSQTKSVDEFIDDIFPSLENASTDYFQKNNVTIITPLNKDTLEINKKYIDKMPQRKKNFFSSDSIKSDDNANLYPVKKLNQYTPNNFPQHKLTICKGAVIICLRNLNARQGLYNGTRLVVKSWTENIIVATILIGPKKGAEVYIPRITHIDHNSKKIYTLIRRQFPIRLCFSKTINKSQGQSYDRVGIYLPTPCFAHGQLYTAVSHVKSPDNLKIYVIDIPYKQGRLTEMDSIVPGTYVQNIVYPEIFHLLDR